MLDYADPTEKSTAVVLIAAIATAGFQSWSPPETVKPIFFQQDVLGPHVEIGGGTFEVDSLKITSVPNATEVWRARATSGTFVTPTQTIPAEDKFSETALTKIENRLQDLRTQSEDEGEPYSQDSERALKAFLGRIAANNRPYIALLDNGNLRATWKDLQGQQIGIQFLGDEHVQFVLFSKREGDVPMAKLFGQDIFSGLIKTITVFNLDDLT